MIIYSEQFKMYYIRLNGQYLHRDGTLHKKTCSDNSGEFAKDWPGYYKTEKEAFQVYERYLKQ